MSARKLPPIHPGEILFEKFMRPLGKSQNRLERDLNAPPRRIDGIVHGRRRISADTASASIQILRYLRGIPA